MFSIAGVFLLFLSLYENGSFTKVFRKAFLFGMFFYIPLYYWFIALYPFDAFGFTMAQGFTIVIAACVGISIYHSLFLAFIALLISKISVSRLFLPVSLACVFLLDEWAISLGPLGFSWGKAAIAQIGCLPLMQTASLFGSYFITLVIVLTGAYLGLAAVTAEKKKPLILFACSIYLISLISGTVLLYLPEKTVASLNVGVVQGNILSNEKWANKGQTSKSIYLGLIDELTASGAYDLIVLPESCFPFIFTNDKALNSQLSSMAMDNNTAIVFGALLNSDGKNYNSCVAYDRDGLMSTPYYKRHLVPFGEYIPSGFDKIPFINKLNLGNMSYTAGTGSELVTLKNGATYGALVCFDSIFADLARTSVNEGAELLIVVTNDSWYEDTRGVYQHASFSKLRAIENGRYVVRAANTGISMAIDSKGRELCAVAPLVQGTASATVYTLEHKTLYCYIGDAILYLVPVLLLILHFINIKAKRESRLKTTSDAYSVNDTTI